MTWRIVTLIAFEIIADDNLAVVPPDRGTFMEQLRDAERDGFAKAVELIRAEATAFDGKHPYGDVQALVLRGLADRLEGKK